MDWQKWCPLIFLIVKQPSVYRLQMKQTEKRLTVSIGLAPALPREYLRPVVCNEDGVFGLGCPRAVKRHQGPTISQTTDFPVKSE